MSITPPGFGKLPSQPLLGPKPSTQSKLFDSPEAEAGTAERDSQRRIEAAERAAREHELEMQKVVDDMKDEYEQQYTKESAREEKALQDQQYKGYEQVRDLQRRQEAEARKIKREGDKRLSDLRENYRNSIYSTENKTREELAELKMQSNRAQEYERKSAEMQNDELATSNQINLAHIREEGERKISSAKETYHRQYEDMQQSSVEAREKAQHQFQDRYTDALTDNNQTIENFVNRAAERLKEIRDEYSTKLSTYQDRLSDPFYRMVDLNGKLYDNGNEFVFMATIPEHEQKHVSVSVRGDEIVISGYRSNSEKSEVAPGHVKGTSAYQSYSESFPLSWPVDSKQLSREFDGNTMIVRLPKKSEFAYQGPYKAAQPNRARVEKPKFPASLEEATREPERTRASSDNPQPAAKGRGTGTLT